MTLSHACICICIHALLFVSAVTGVVLTCSCNATHTTSITGNHFVIRKLVCLQTDGIIIINAVGSIMMVNAALSRMFGYEKGELDGKNVAALMPQPYSARHATYLQKYNSTGQAKSIGTLRQLVALNKVCRCMACSCSLLHQHSNHKLGLSRAELVSQLTLMSSA